MDIPPCFEGHCCLGGNDTFLKVLHWKTFLKYNFVFVLTSLCIFIRCTIAAYNKLLYSREYAHSPRSFPLALI